MSKGAIEMDSLREKGKAWLLESLHEIQSKYLDLTQLEKPLIIKISN